MQSCMRLRTNLWIDALLLKTLLAGCDAWLSSVGGSPITLAPMITSPHRGPVLVQYCADNTSIYSLDDFHHANQFVASSLVAAVRANTEGLTLYATRFASNTFGQYPAALPRPGYARLSCAPHSAAHPDREQSRLLPRDGHRRRQSAERRHRNLQHRDGARERSTRVHARPGRPTVERLESRPSTNAPPASGAVCSWPVSGSPVLPRRSIWSSPPT